MQRRKKIAVAGATGRVGRPVVDILRVEGYEVVPISRSGGVDLVTGEGLAQALAGVECVIDAASTPVSDQKEATEYFTAASRNLQKLGEKAGVQRMVAVSIIGTDRFTTGYVAGKIAHEKAMLSGAIPVHILRAAQFHEFVELLMSWGRQGDRCYVPKMRTQLVAAGTVARALVDLATDPEFTAAPTTAKAPFPDIAGPREENLAAMAKLIASRRGDPLIIEEVSDPANPEYKIYESGGLLPRPHATLAGPTFEDWLDSTARVGSIG